MDKFNDQSGEPTNGEKKKSQLEIMLKRLENQRSVLNKAAEKQYEENGNLSGVVFCEEQDEFNRISNEISELLSEIQTTEICLDNESEKNK